MQKVRTMVYKIIEDLGFKDGYYKLKVLYNNEEFEYGSTVKPTDRYIKKAIAQYEDGNRNKNTERKEGFTD